MINNRQAGRRRGRNNNPRQNGGGNRGNGDSGNRVDNRSRGNAAQLLEKYRNMARDAQLAGDRVNAEYYLQFADHYFRVLADNRSRQEEQQQRFQRNDEPVGDSYDMANEGDEGVDDGDEAGDEFQASQQQRDQQQGRREGNRSNETGRERNRDTRGNRDDRGPREDRAPREDRGNRDTRGNREERGERRPRIANDDSGDDNGMLNLAALPPAIGRIEPDAGNDEASAPEAVEAVAKPRRGRRPRSAEAAE
ncbi:MAG: DUF4167 domain-containing protein [Sphingobium sp.]|nr:DUF4167 domain-containing protein [Sphingobium sp.]